MGQKRRFLQRLALAPGGRLCYDEEKLAEAMEMYSTQVKTATLPVADWLAKYCVPAEFAEACRACPDYGKVWSCPPGVPMANTEFAPYHTAHIVAVQVIYDGATRAAASTPQETNRLREECYGKVKRALLDGLLAAQEASPRSDVIAAGRCEQCARCARLDNLPCRKPERRRYSFSAFGFDLTRMAGELLGIKLLWAKNGLPEYDVALAAFLE
ncbi:MAG: DUF2284 domain-containing protein [Pseudoflavonifractor sp.]